MPEVTANRVMSGRHRSWQATVSIQRELVWAANDRSDARVWTGGRPSMTITTWSTRSAVGSGVVVLHRADSL